jgi:hypothetical protein
MSAKKAATKNAPRPPAKKAAKKAARKATTKKAAKKGSVTPAATQAGKKGPWNMRVRMYRQGLGDCFLVSLKKDEGGLFHIVIDCGVLMGTEDVAIRMTEVVDDIASDTGGTVDLLVVTHEHWDHVSGFHQARESWDKIIVKEVWMGWTENPRDPQARRLGQARQSALRMLAEVAGKLPAGLKEGVNSLIGFSGEILPAAGRKTTGMALDYIRGKGGSPDAVKYLNPGTGPIDLDGVSGVRVFSLGPPRDEKLLKKSEVLKRDKADGVVYGLRGEAMSLAAAAGFARDEINPELSHPFSKELRLDPKGTDPTAVDFRQTYGAHGWRKVDDDWMSAFGDLALKLDSDTNNTSLVLAFEFVRSGKVALFVGDAQVGNWQSWDSVRFQDGDGDPKREIPASDLVARTCFYKGGHHLSHNATLAKGGLELMERDDLVVFGPVDKTMAAKQGRVVNGVPKGWEMPAKHLYKALKRQAGNRVVLSDRNEPIPPEAEKAGVTSTALYIEYHL